MKTVGIICEYSPFHNGHEYHIKQIKNLYPDATIVLILSGNFTQRGLPSILDKWTKTQIALQHGVDLVVELPFVFATQSADIFARGSISLLKALNVDILVFGSEENNIQMLQELAHIQCNNPKYDQLVKTYLQEGVNYPTAMSKALESFHSSTITSPNDLLGLSYVKEIIRQQAKIEPVTIQRTNDFHDTKSTSDIVSATRIRTALQNNEDISHYVPSDTLSALNEHVVNIEDYWPLLFYRLSLAQTTIASNQTVDEGIEHRILKHFPECSSIEELTHKIKTKRYTYNKLMRMSLHILCNFTKEEAKEIPYPTYIRVLGMNQAGISYLNSIKKNCPLPIISALNQMDDLCSQIEYRTTAVYSSTFTPEKRKQLLAKEFQKKPIIQKNTL